MEIATADKSDWTEIARIIETQAGKNAVPTQSMAFASVAKDKGTVVGFLVVQFQAHAEPIWIAPAYRGHGLVRKLKEKIDSLGISYYSFSPNRAMSRMLSGLGLEKKNWEIFVKEF